MTGGYSVFAVHRLLVVASLVTEHRHTGFRSGSSLALQHRLNSWRHTGLVAPCHVRSSQARDRIRILCTDRRVLVHWTTRDTLLPSLLLVSFGFTAFSLVDVVLVNSGCCKDCHRLGRGLNIRHLLCLLLEAGRCEIRLLGRIPFLVCRNDVSLPSAHVVQRDRIQILWCFSL